MTDRNLRHGYSDKYLRTDHLTYDLQLNSFYGSIVMLASNATQFLLTVGTTMVLARLLTPYDFGLLAMVSVLMGLVRTFRDFGLPMAIVHEETLDHMQMSKLFWFNIKLNFLITIFMAAMAPLISWFFDESKLIIITLVITIGVFANGTTNLHFGLLRRQMHFKIISLIEVTSMSFGAATGLSLALLGLGYWSLVFQQLTIFISRAVFLWFACKWRPANYRETTKASDSITHTLITFGKHTALARFVDYIGNELDRILVGRFAGAAQLGLYQNAHRWTTFTMDQIFLPVKSVAIAGCCRLRDMPDRYSEYVRYVFLAVFTASLPTLAFLFVNAHDIVLFLLGTKWLDAVPIFKILSIAAIAKSLSRITIWVYLSEGQTKRRIHWTLISTPLMVTGMIAGVTWGTVGVATGFTIASCLLAYPSILFCLKTSTLDSRDFWAAVWRPASATVVATTFLFVFNLVLPNLVSLSSRLALHALIFGVIYFGFWIGMPGGLRNLSRVISLVRSPKS